MNGRSIARLQHGRHGSWPVQMPNQLAPSAAEIADKASGE